MNNLLEELELIIQDARRYRWLRDAEREVPEDCCAVGIVDYIMVGDGGGSRSATTGDRLDFVVDEAMEADLMKRFVKRYKKS